MDNYTMLKQIIKPVLLIVISITLFFTSYKGLGLIVFAIYLIDNFYKLNYYFKKENDLHQLVKSIDTGLSDNVLQFIYPFSIINEEGKIIWNNNLFNSLRSKEEAKEDNILSIARNLELSQLLSEEGNKHQRTEIQDKIYDVYASPISGSDKNLFLISFNDITKLIDYETTQESIVLVEVDNYSDVVDSMEDSNIPLLIAEIDKKMNSYASNLKAMIRKYDTNKYVLSVQDKYIEDEILQEFKIIDEFSKIEVGNKIKVTLSIGIGKGGMSPQENYNNAAMSKELALGRGGDQVVLKNKKDIKFFGGNSKEIEKRTKVKTRVIANALSELIYESSNIYIIGHKNPDMDCFGASVGLASIIKQMGKNCNVILNRDVNAIEYYLNKLANNSKYDGLFKSSEEVINKMDSDTLVVILDVHNKSYISDLHLVEKAERKVIIDHHRRSPDMIEHDILNYIEVYASSTSEMITEIIQYMVEKPNLTSLEAEGLLAGIYMDTKAFSLKTGIRTFEAASFLKSMGADMIEIKKMFTDELSDYLLIAETIKSVTVKEKIAIAVAPDNIGTVIIAKAADELLNISGICVSFVLGRINDSIYLSGRSLGDINVQIIMESLGGGGHMNIAGAKIDNTSIEDVLDQLNESIEQYLRIGE